MSEAEPPVEAAPLELDATSLELGRVACGASSARTVTATNTSDEPMTLAIASTLPGVTVTPATLEVAALGTATFEVTATVAQESVPGIVARGDLMITFEGGSTALPISLEPSGAIVTLDQSTIDLGTLLPGSFRDRELVVSVTGNEPATVAFALPERPFRFFGETPATLAPGTSKSFSVALDGQERTERLVAELPMTVTGTLCAAAPPSPTLVGAVDENLLELDHTAIDFGRVACNATPSRTLKITNHTELVTDYSARFDGGTLLEVGSFTVALDADGLFSTFASGLIAAEHVIPFTMVAVPRDVDLPPGVQERSLDIAFNDDGFTRRFPVRVELLRPIPVLSVEELQVGTIAPGAVVTRTFDITNDGNDIAPLELTAGNSATVSPQSFQLAPGATATVTVTLAASAATTFPSFVHVTDGCDLLGRSILVQGVLAN